MAQGILCGKSVFSGTYCTSLSQSHMGPTFSDSTNAWIHDGSNHLAESARWTWCRRSIVSLFRGRMGKETGLRALLTDTRLCTGSGLGLHLSPDYPSSDLGCLRNLLLSSVTSVYNWWVCGKNLHLEPSTRYDIWPEWPATKNSSSSWSMSRQWAHRLALISGFQSTQSQAAWEQALECDTFITIKGVTIGEKVPTSYRPASLADWRGEMERWNLMELFLQSC